MNKYKLNLRSIERVKNFVNITSSIEEELDIVVGRYIIDAKSIMGIFSVDLSRDLTLVISSDDPIRCKEIACKLKEFIVEEENHE